MSDSDLSSYEKLRLENIRRNAEFLNQLGLAEVKPVKVPKTSVKSESLRKPKRKKSEVRVQTQQPVRKSSRLQNLAPESTGLVTSAESETEGPATTSEDEGVRYDLMPLESDELDDFEFEVYAALRKWRLLKSRELQTESYKICQNRTLAEMVRRRRNDPTWAAPVPSLDTPSATQSDVAVIATTHEADASNNSGTAEAKTDGDADVAAVGSSSSHSSRSRSDTGTDEGDDKPDRPATSRSVCEDLLECWGVGPSKAREGGYGHELITLLDGDERLRSLLRQSRDAERQTQRQSQESEQPLEHTSSDEERKRKHQ